MSINLMPLQKVFIKQVHEIGEWIGFETRNKYQILNEQNSPIGFAAEQQKGFWGFILRQYLGHWRKFDVHFFDNEHHPYLIAHHPFRWFFERIEVKDANGKYLGALQKRFSIFTKRFDVENEQGMVILEVSSPIWKLWTFPFMHKGNKIAEVKKKWSGILSEAFTDKDNFTLEYIDNSINEDEKKIILVSAVFIDLMYFENKR